MRDQIVVAIDYDIAAIRQQNPLIHNVTNFVVMQQTANALLALGASPIMAHAEEELPELLQLAHALVINIGTLDNSWITQMHQALQLANARKIPIVLDPVGAGASKLRTQTALALLETGAIAILRGNAGEILSLAGANAIESKGVDSQYTSDSAIVAAQELATRYRCTVTVSGISDLVTDGSRIIKVNNGDALMIKVTGMGCTATAVSAAFCAVQKDYFVAAVHAMAVMGITGEIAAERSRGPGTFAINFLDALYHLSEKDIHQGLSLALG